MLGQEGDDVLGEGGGAVFLGGDAPREPSMAVRARNQRGR